MIAQAYPDGVLLAGLFFFVFFFKICEKFALFIRSQFLDGHEALFFMDIPGIC